MQLKNISLFRQQCYIDGQWQNASNNTTISVTNPANGVVIGTVPCMGADETRHAIKIANQSWPSWRTKTAKERSAILRRWAELIVSNQDDLALLMTTEQGKPLTESKAEIVYAASFIEWFSEEAKRVYGDVIPHSQVDKRIIVIKQSIGVCAMITPWNFPAAMITRKCAPALAAGCTVVLKPAEQTPFTALALAHLAEQAGLPNGVLNIITGTPENIGREMTSNPIVRKLSFTGSTQVGRLLMQQCAPTIKKLSLELGGNAPFIVFDDADLDAAVDGAFASKYRNTGQTCVCANRILVHEKIYDEFSKKLTTKVKQLKVGNGIEDNITQGPLIDENAVKKVEQHVADATSKGAKILIGGKRHGLGGTFYEPTILTQVTETMLINKEETFGPVAALIKFTTDEEAIQIANDTEFGLVGYFYSRDIGRIWRVAELLECGMVGINTGLVSTEVAPFGGVKQSGLGREGSKYGIEEYLEIKYLCFGDIK